MNKKTIAFLLGIIIIILIVLIFGKKSSLPIVLEDGSFKGEYSIKNIMALGKPYRCSFNKSDGTSFISGSLLISEDKIRGDFDITIPSIGNGGFASHFIVSDEYSYNWTSIEPIGYKTKIIENSVNSNDKEEQAQLIGINDKVTYECTPWNSDLTAFEIPKGIQFSELTSS